MEISQEHYQGLVLLCATVSKSFSADALGQLIGQQGEAQYELLSSLVEEHVGSVSTTLPVVARRVILGAIRALTPGMPVCEVDGELPLVRQPGGDWRQVDTCPKCGGLLAVPKPPERLFNWVTGHYQDPTVPYHIGGGLRVPLRVAELAAELGGLDPRLQIAALQEGTDVPNLLRGLLVEKCNGDVRYLRENLTRLPDSWTASNGLRMTARNVAALVALEAKETGVPVGRQDFMTAVYDAAVEVGLLGDRRDVHLAMTGIPANVRAALRTYSRATDQLRSDLLELRGFGGDYLRQWLRAAVDMTAPRTQAGVFRWALSVLDGTATVRTGDVTAGAVGVVVEAGGGGVDVSMGHVSGRGTVGIVFKGR